MIGTKTKVEPKGLDIHFHIQNYKGQWCKTRPHLCKERSPPCKSWWEWLRKIKRQIWKRTCFAEQPPEQTICGRNCKKYLIIDNLVQNKQTNKITDNERQQEQRRQQQQQQQQQHVWDRKKASHVWILADLFCYERITNLFRTFWEICICSKCLLKIRISRHLQ